MFRLKKSGTDSKETVPANKSPDTGAKVRTFKEDFENFGKAEPGQPGQYFTVDEYYRPPAPEKNFRETTPSTGQEFSQPDPTLVDHKNQPANPFQPVPMPPPLSSPVSNLSSSQTSSSQSFFSGKPSASENIIPQRDEAKLSASKPGKKLAIPLIILLAVIAAAAGFYYYWFYIKNSSPAAPSADKNTSTAAQPNPVNSSSTPQNKNLHQLVVDTAQSPTEIKNAVTKYTASFLSSASENDLIEVKILGKDNQPVGKKDFFAGFGITVPDTLSMKLSEDYSLFIKKENNAAWLGLAFKMITSSGVAQEMTNWEPKITADLNSLYPAAPVSSGTSSFKSSQYNNADIRYFNFSSPANTSLDYSIISNFLVIATSKDSMHSILDYMSGK